MEPSTSTGFTSSSLVIHHNAIKNVVFRAATIILQFFILRLFGLLAFRRKDYTSFLMFAEDILQKALFISSRGFTARQSLLVGVFALIAFAGEFYDTMLWAIENPGYVMQHSRVSAATLASHLSNNPTYVVNVLVDTSDPTHGNNLETAFNPSLYALGFNFTLPGVVEPGTVEVVPPLVPLSPVWGAPRIWLDNEGFAVTTDFTSMQTANMSSSTKTACVPGNALNLNNTQVWNCNIPNTEANGILQMKQGGILIWWDKYHLDSQMPYADNPWANYGTGGGSVMMKQIFTVTKGLRRHTFMQTVIKATMAAPAPEVLADEEISDFMRKTWSPDGTITPGVQELTDIVLYAKGNETGRTFGELVQDGTSVLSMTTDFMNVTLPNTGQYYYSILRFSLVNITLIRSETLDKEPTPVEPCPGKVYRNDAAAGVPIFSSCNAAELVNQTMPLNGDPFLGQVDISTVAILTGLLGDGSSNLSSIALSQKGLDWATEESDHLNKLLTSRALILGGNSSAVMVDVGTSVVAISALQLLLCIIPVVFAILVWLFTRKPAMSYYQNTFLAAVLATTHTASTPCEELGYVRSMPEITLQSRGRHVTLGTPHDGTISNTVSLPVDQMEMAYEPLILPKDRL